MTNEQLLVECKIGLGIPLASTGHDGVLSPKIRAVKSFMTGAGVSVLAMDNDLAVGVIVMGVTDLWSLQGGEIKFSPVFYTLLGQLAMY